MDPDIQRRGPALSVRPTLTPARGVRVTLTSGRIEAAPKFGCLEVWRVITGGGGWHHPVHLHLIDGWILNRQNGRAAEANGVAIHGVSFFCFLISQEMVCAHGSIFLLWAIPHAPHILRFEL